MHKKGKKSFWNSLPRPIITLSPMADVTDAALRRIIVKYGKPDVMFTEFVSCDGLCSEGKEKLIRKLSFTEAERPIVAQIFGSVPDNIYKCAILIRSLGFDGIDINMGCPDRSVEKQKAGAYLIKNPSLAREIVSAAKDGAKHIPVSVKTRIGYEGNIIERWASELLDMNLDAITFHLRTRNEMSKVPARWDVVSIPVKMFKNTKTAIIGNGDVKDIYDAREKVDKYGVDGVMIGRAIIGRPWLFSGCRIKSERETLKIMLEHVKLYEKLFVSDTLIKNKKKGNKFHVIRKHMGAYVKGFKGASDLRNKLIRSENSAEVEKIVKNFITRPVITSAMRVL